MTDPKILSEIYPSFEADVQTNAGNIFTPMITNDNMRMRTVKRKKEDKGTNNKPEELIASPTNKLLIPKAILVKNMNKRKISVNAGKGAINYMQLPN